MEEEERQEVGILGRKWEYWEDKVSLKQVIMWSKFFWWKIFKNVKISQNTHWCINSCRNIKKSFWLLLVLLIESSCGLNLTLGGGLIHLLCTDILNIILHRKYKYKDSCKDQKSTKLKAL